MSFGRRRRCWRKQHLGDSGSPEGLRPEPGSRRRRQGGRGVPRSARVSPPRGVSAFKPLPSPFRRGCRLHPCFRLSSPSPAELLFPAVERSGGAEECLCTSRQGSREENLWPCSFLGAATGWTAGPLRRKRAVQQGGAFGGVRSPALSPPAAIRPAALLEVTRRRRDP